MKLNRMWIIFILTLLPSISIAMANSPHYKLSLREAILLALRFNPSVQSAEVQRTTDKFNLMVAKYQFEFQYGLAGAAKYSATRSNNAETRVNQYAMTPALTRQTVYGTQFNFSLQNPINGGSANSTYYNPLWSLNISQPLLQGSGRQVVESALNTAVNTEEIAKLNLKNTIMNTLTQIILDYNAVISAENTLIIDQNALKIAEKIVQQNKSRIEAGFMAPSENVQAEANVAVQKLQVASDRNVVIQTKLALTNDIGLYPTANITINKNIPLANSDYARGNRAEELMLANNIQYQTQLYTLRNSRLNLIQAKDQQRWTLNFDTTITQGGGTGGGRNAGFPSLINGYNQSRVYGLSLTVPIENKQIQQVLVNSRVALTQQELAVKLLKLQLARDLQGAIQNLDILRQQIILSMTSQALANKSYQDALIQLDYGQVSVFEVNVLQTNLITAQLAVLTNQINFSNALAQYQQSLGITLDVWKIGVKY